MRQLQPPGWPQPRGYANGIEATGKLIFVGGMIGWDEHQRFPHADLAGQVQQALENIVAVLKEAGADPENVARLTWYVTSADEYVEHQKEIGAAYRAVMGRHFPAMAVVEVVTTGREAGESGDRSDRHPLIAFGLVGSRFRFRKGGRDVCGGAECSPCWCVPSLRCRCARAPGHWMTGRR